MIFLKTWGVWVLLYSSRVNRIISFVVYDSSHDNITLFSDEMRKSTIVVFRLFKNAVLKYKPMPKRPP